MARTVIRLRPVPAPPPVRDRPVRADTIDHDRLSAGLKARPGQWFELVAAPLHVAYTIRSGGCRVYRARGQFEATVREGAVYARYVGADHFGPQVTS